MKNAVLLLTLSMLFMLGCQRSPEKLPKYKKAFKSQIDKFEAQKVKTDKKIEEGVVELSGLEKAIAEAADVDKEFNRVYGDWNKVNRQVENLYSDYEKLKRDANNLFSAMTEQSESLGDQTTKNQLLTAIKTIRGDYDKNLARTEVAVNKLKSVHTDAMDVIKALEVAVALGQIDQYNSGLQNIEDKVSTIMAELNSSIKESKALYDERIDRIGG